MPPAARLLVAIGLSPWLHVVGELIADCEQIATTRNDLQAESKWCFDVHVADVRACCPSPL